MTPNLRLVFELRADSGYVDGKDFCDDDLAGIPLSTTCLNLENAQITDSGIFNLPQMDNLRCFDLDNTKISDAAMARIAHFSNLEELWIEQTAISDAGIHYLHKNKKLKFISIVDCDITDAALDELEAAIPGVAIH